MTLLYSAAMPGTRVRPGLLTDCSARVEGDGKCLSRDEQKLHVQGVTYGPFAPDARGHQFPVPDIVRHDLAGIRRAGFNAIRTYHVPPPWLFELAAEQNILLFVDVPWRKHVCFHESHVACEEARKAVREAARAGSHHSNLLAYSIGNEIPSEI